MVKQIIWSENALQDRLQILNYWFKKTGNKKYSNYLDTSFRDIVSIIGHFPRIGRVYKNSDYRFMIKDNYMLFYELSENIVSILAIFDTRRNPAKIEKKLKN